MSFGVVIVKSVAIVGVLLVFSYLVVPAVIAQMWSITVRGKLLVGWLMAILASTLGIVWSFYSDYPTGPAVVVMLSLFLILSAIVYTVRHSQAKIRALSGVVTMLLFGLFFFYSLSYFKKTSPATQATQLAPVDLFLNEIKQDQESAQLDGASHLADMRDPRIVPALTELLSRSSSEQVVEATVEALGKQRDPRAIPALRQIVKGNYDDFLKFSIARSQLAVGDPEGYLTAIKILKDEDAGFARQKANELLEEKSGRKFGYDPEQSVTHNRAALQKLEEWWKREGSHLKWDAQGLKFHQ